MRPKEQISRFAQILIFSGALLFVVHRGWMCFDKFLKKPVTTFTLKKFASEQSIFPAISYCKTLSSNPLKDEVLEECNINASQYGFRGQVWTGQGSEDYCSDANELDKMVYMSISDYVYHEIKYRYYFDQILL